MTDNPVEIPAKERATAAATDALGGLPLTDRGDVLSRLIGDNVHSLSASQLGDLIDFLTTERVRRDAQPEETPPDEKPAEPAEQAEQFEEVDAGAASDPTADQAEINNIRAELEKSEVERKVEAIVAQITDNAMYGKFNRGTILDTGNLDPVEVTTHDGRDYDIYTNSSILAKDAFIALMNRRCTALKRALGFTQIPEPDKDKQGYEKAREKLGQHFMAFTELDRVEEDETPRTIVEYNVNNYGRDGTGRRAGFVDLVFIMPRAAGKELEALIRENPDAAEIFYQEATGGLDYREGAVEIYAAAETRYLKAIEKGIRERDAHKILDAARTPGIGRMRSNKLTLLNPIDKPVGFVAELDYKNGPYGVTEKF